MSAYISDNQLNLLGNRIGYNLALRHFRKTQEMVADIEEGYNLADLINSALDDNQIEKEQIQPIMNILLVEKYGYAFKSENVSSQVESLTNLKETVKSWSNIQIILVCISSNDTIALLNPDRLTEAREELFPIRKGSFITCYAGCLEKTDKDTLQSAVDNVFTLLYNGGKVKARSGYRGTASLKKFRDAEQEQSLRGKAPGTVPSPAVTSNSASATVTRKTLSKKIGVNVTNELFHNGNVEAWKRIIESYKLKYSSLDVLIWYDGERIDDINALFKWGKVKHGTPILFSVVGDAPAEVSKLKKYLFEGASPRFEAFLGGNPGSVLRLFG